MFLNVDFLFIYPLGFISIAQAKEQVTSASKRQLFLLERRLRQAGNKGVVQDIIQVFYIYTSESKFASSLCIR